MKRFQRSEGRRVDISTGIKLLNDKQMVLRNNSFLFSFLSSCLLLNCILLFCTEDGYKDTSSSNVRLKFQRIIQDNHLNSEAFMKFPLFYLVTITHLLLITMVQSNSVFKAYPFGQDYFEKIYLVDHNGQEYYLVISCKEQNMLSISITTANDFIESPTFNIYGTTTNRPKMGRGSYTFLQECHAHVEVNTSNFLQVKRSRQSETIFAIADLTFQPNHIQFTVYDQSVKWGFGERFQKRFHVGDGKWTIWNRDKPWKIDEGRIGISQQTYGHHPLYLAREKQSKLHHLAYYKNTYGLFIQSNQNSNELIYHSIGGNVHFLIILGQQNPQEVLQRYHDYIGRGHIPPFWSFGHHQCRWGYRTLQQIKNVVKKYKQHDIPLDTFWSDLQYMSRKMIFTINEQTHPSRELNALIKDEQLHFVPLLDVGVSINDLQAISRGKELNAFFKNHRNQNQYYTGQVWPGIVHFVDYLHPNATLFWKEQLKRLHNSVNFSGIWLDMNEPSNFRGGEAVEESFKVQQNQNLNMMTISADLPHYNEKNPSIPLKHKQVHAYYGHLSTVPTFQFLSEHGRPFIISRSTSVGSGHFVGHWTGDNVATWDFLRLSISGNFLFQIFGIQMVGADICGFYQNTNEELCSRWHQVGAFYPFARNHNHEQAKSQQPWTFGPILLQTSRESIKTRYALLKQLYTIYLEKKGKGSYYRPLTFEFYDDENAYEQETIQTQVLIGKSLMTTPIVYQGHEQRDVYFPGTDESWHQFQISSQTGMVDVNKITKFDGKTKQVILNPLPSAPPTFLRGGYMLLTTSPENRSIKLSNQFHIFAALKDNQANGTILAIQNYNDQSKIKKCISQNCLFVLAIKKIGQQTFSINWNFVGSKDLMGTIKIKSIVIAASGKKWKSEDIIVISIAQGNTTIEAQQIK